MSETSPNPTDRTPPMAEGPQGPSASGQAGPPGPPRHPGRRDRDGDFSAYEGRRRSAFEHLLHESGWPLLATLGLAFGLAVGWQIFISRVEVRTEAGMHRGDEVRKIWGGPLHQPGPIVHWRRQDAATAGLASGEISRSDVTVDLDVQYRTRGRTRYPGYSASFVGRYAVPNPSKDPAFVAFSIGLPSERSSLMLSSLELLIDGREEPAATEYTATGIRWTGPVAAAHTTVFELRYEARGLERFSYGLVAKDDEGPVHQGPVANLLLTLNVRGAEGTLDYPVGAMSPTAERSEGDQTTLIWDVERVLTAFDAAVVVPEPSTNTAMRALVRATNHAPWFFVLFAASMVYALARLTPFSRALHLAGMACVYFVFFPLTMYVADYLPWTAAVVLTALLSSAMIILHAYRFAGRGALIRAATSTALFLVIPIVAHLAPEHAGLILVATGFVAGSLLLHLVGALARHLETREERARPPGDAFAAVSGHPEELGHGRA